MFECNVSLQRLMEHFNEYPSGYISDPISGASENCDDLYEELNRMVRAIYSGPEEILNRDIMQINTSQDANRIRMCLLGCYILSLENLIRTDLIDRERKRSARGLFGRRARGQSAVQSLPAMLNQFLTEGYRDLANLIAAEDIVSSEERREEFIRATLLAVNSRPQGEDEKMAMARFQEISSVHRAREQERREAEEIERQLREERESYHRATRE